MANTKISELTELNATPANSDELAIVDSGTTKRISVSNLMGAVPSASVEGTAILSTGESGGTKFLREDGDNSCSWQTVPDSSSLPTYASTNRPSNPSTGNIIYETDTGRISVFDATAGLWRYWVQDGAVDPNEIVNNYSTQYDAVDDLGTATIASSSMSGDFTLSFWMNGANVSGSNVHSMMSSNYGYADGWGLLRKSSNTFHIYYYYSGGSGWVYNGITSGMSDNTWTHIVLARTGSDLKTYVSGNLINTTTLANNISFSGSDLKTNDGYRSASYLDEVAVWSSDQSANISEMRTASNTPKNLNAMTTNPLYWWRQGDDNSGTGTTISNNSNATGGTVNWMLTNGASINSSVKP